jgi:hypothetical protein
MEATQTTSQPVHRDTDGIPPGLDIHLYGAVGLLKFSGVFFAAPELGDTTFVRPVQIVFASKEILVCKDRTRHNLYVVDRRSGISLGCRMQAVFIKE